MYIPFVKKPTSQKELAEQTNQLKYIAAAGSVMVVAINIAIASWKLAAEVKK